MTTVRRRVAGWWGLALFAVMLLAIPWPPHLIERVYSRTTFRWWQAIVTTLSNLVPFACLDVLIVVVAGASLWRGVRLVSGAREQGIIRALWEGCTRLLRASAVLSIVFLAMWGFNYRRVPLSETLPATPPPTVRDLQALLSDVIDLAARTRPAGGAVNLSTPDLMARLRQPMNAALVEVGRSPLRVVGRPKDSMLLTPFFTLAGVDGMVDPFALETILHPGLLPFERPFSLAHEWAHLAGAADEAEASAIGWLACMHGDPNLAYSASLYLIVEGANALPRGAWRETASRLDPGVRADLAAMAERQRRQRPTVQRAAFGVYDTYLRANHVGDGVASYSRALKLIWSPPIRAAVGNYGIETVRQP